MLLTATQRGLGVPWNIPDHPRGKEEERGCWSLSSQTHIRCAGAHFSWGWLSSEFIPSLALLSLLNFNSAHKFSHFYPCNSLSQGVGEWLWGAQMLGLNPDPAHPVFGQHMEIYQHRFCSQFLRDFLFLVLSMSLPAQINSLT